MDDQDTRDGQPQVDVIDAHVGAQVRIRRKAMGISQSDLAKELGLTFQQVQKYERGANRISSSKLFEIARVLRTKPEALFEGLPDPETSGIGEAASADLRTIQQFLMTPEGPALALLVRSMSDANRNRVFNLLWALTSDEAAI